MADAQAVFKALADFSQVGTESAKAVGALQTLERETGTLTGRIEGHLRSMSSQTELQLRGMRNDMAQTALAADTMATRTSSAFDRTNSASLVARGAGDNIRHIGSESSIASGLLSSFGDGVDTLKGRLSGLFEVAVKSAGVAGLALGAMGTVLGGLGIKFNATKEQQTIAFTQLLGDADKGKKALEDILDVASKTPFEQENLTNLVRQLLAGGVAYGQILDTSGKKAKGLAVDIGDAVSALGGGPAELAGIGRAFSQIATKGRVQSEELLQIAERGIPVFKMLQKEFGVTGVELTGMLRNGEISTEEFFTAFNKGVVSFNLAGAMDKQSQSFMGRISTLKDNAKIILGSLTEPLFKSLSGFLGVAGDALQGFTTDLKEGLPVSEALANNFPGLVPVFETIQKVGGFLASMFTTLYYGVKGFFSAAEEGVTSTGFVGFMETLGLWVSKNGDLIKNVLLVALGLFLGGLTPVGVIIALLITNLDKLAEFWDKNGEKITALAKNIAGDFMSVLNSLWGVVQNLLPILQGIGIVIGGAILIALPLVSEAFKVLAGVLDVIAGIFDGPLGVVLGGLAATLVGITGAVWGANKAFDKGKETIQSLKDGVKGAKEMYAKFGDNVRDAAKWVGDTASKTKDLVVQNAKLVGAKIASFAKSAAAGFRTLAAGLMSAARAGVAFLVANPWILVLIAIVAAIVLLIKHWDKVKDAVAFVMDFAGKAISAGWEFIQKVFSTGMEIIKKVIITGLKLIAIAMFLPFVPLILFITKFQEIKEAFGKVVVFLRAKIGDIVDFFVELPGRVWDAAKDVFQFLIDKMTAAKDWIWDRITDIVDFFVKLPGRLLSAGATVFDWVKDKMTAAKDWVWQRIQDIFNFFVELPGRFIRGVGNIFDFVKDKMTAAKDWVWERIQDVFNYFVELPGRFLRGAGNIFEWIKDKMLAAKNWVVERGEDLFNFFKDLPARMLRGAGNIFDFLKDSFKGAFNWLVDKWNKLEFTIPAIKIGPVGFDSFVIGMPDIPLIRHAGGMVTGSGASDVFTMLQPGEFVLQRSAVKSIGAPILNALNSGLSDAGGGSGGVHIEKIEINNPVGETAEESLTRSMQKLEYAGYFG